MRVCEVIIPMCAYSYYGYAPYAPATIYAPYAPATIYAPYAPYAPATISWLQKDLLSDDAQCKSSEPTADRCSVPV